MIDVIRRHPVASYFILAVSVSWAGVLAVIVPTALPTVPTTAERLFVPVYLAMLLGPSVAGLAITAIVGGREGLREFRARLVDWRVEGRWYAIALLAAPLALGLALLALRAVSAAYAPSPLMGAADTAGPIRTGGALPFVAVGLAVGIGAGFFEELGWTGVAVPRVLERRGILATGLGVGLVWGAWHYLAIHWGSANAVGSVPTVLYLAVALFSFLPPYRVLMVWVYRHTRSLFVGILMHMALTSSLLLLGPAVSGHELLVFDLTFGAVLWTMVAIVLVIETRGTAEADQACATSAPGREIPSSVRSTRSGSLGPTESARSACAMTPITVPCASTTGSRRT